MSFSAACKALIAVACAARLRSCPDTRFGAGLEISAGADWAAWGVLTRALEAAEKLAGSPDTGRAVQPRHLQAAEKLAGDPKSGRAVPAPDF
jgi:hypothetical protein